MFTGIVETTGTVANIKKTDELLTLTIHSENFLDHISTGDSISVNGTCLTVTAFTSNTFSVDVMNETRKITTVDELKLNNEVNLERSLTANKEIGGHFVTGHVDCTGVITALQNNDDTHIFTIKIPDNYKSHLMKQGSITVDGISLTIFDVLDNEFKIHIIPETLRVTTLKYKNIGDIVNIETDMIMKYVDHILKNREVHA